MVSPGPGPFSSRSSPAGCGPSPEGPAAFPGGRPGMAVRGAQAARRLRGGSGRGTWRSERVLLGLGVEACAGVQRWAMVATSPGGRSRPRDVDPEDTAAGPKTRTAPSLRLPWGPHNEGGRPGSDLRSSTLKLKETQPCAQESPEVPRLMGRRCLRPRRSSVSQGEVNLDTECRIGPE